MADDHLADVLRVCDEALARDSAERAAYLDAACGADTALRREVDALLAGQSAAPGVLDTPAWTPARPPLSAGTRLGPYQVEALIGAGGMGEVYKARDTRLGRDVAIKVLLEGAAAAPDLRRRFEQEARAVAALSHPNVVALHDIGTHDGAPFIVSELLEGMTLAEALHDGALPVGKATDIGIQIAKGLAAAHAQSIVHRDLKPANVFLLTGGHVKILDFGIAKLTHADPGTETTELTTLASPTDRGTVMGTVGYMAPEQVRGLPCDHRADIFAFGCVLYEMLSGHRAFNSPW